MRSRRREVVDEESVLLARELVAGVLPEVLQQVPATTSVVGDQHLKLLYVSRSELAATLILLPEPDSLDEVDA